MCIRDRRWCEQRLPIVEELMERNPSSAEAKRDLASAHYLLGLAIKSRDHLRRAFVILSNMEKSQILADADRAWLEMLKQELSSTP